MIVRTKLIKNNTKNQIKDSNKIDKRWDSLLDIINAINDECPYNKDNGYKYVMWNEQANINFPILYLASIYLYIYAKQKGCTTFLFATRDCSHWHKIFKKMFPHTNVHYFNCSRVMLEKATKNGNEDYNEYVKSLVDDVEKTIYIDLHGTGKRIFSYFEAVFEKVPYCFLLSATYKTYNLFPEISQQYYKQGKFINLVFNARGSPIEMLNYDLVGTLQDFSFLIGPIRDKLEYDRDLINLYHDAMDHIVQKIQPIKKIKKIEKNYDLISLNTLIDQLYDCIKQTRPVIANRMMHVSKHEPNNSGKFLKKINFSKILSNNTTYGVIWEGSINNEPCVIKMVMLSSGRMVDGSEKKDRKPFYHKEFIDKKPMTVKSFLNEVQNITDLSSIGLSPKMYGYWICDKLYDYHYGFIITKRVECSLKHVIIERDISKKESLIIEKMIKQLHKNEFIHGDLKPSNIGVNLDHKGKIKECFLFDCQKVKSSRDFSLQTFNLLVQRDWSTYHRHIIKNKSEANPQ